MLIPPETPNFSPPSYTAFSPKTVLEYLEFWKQFKEYYSRMYVYSLQQVEYFQAKLDQEGK